MFVIQANTNISFQKQNENNTADYKQTNDDLQKIHITAMVNHDIIVEDFSPKQEKEKSVSDFHIFEFNQQQIINGLKP